MPCIRKLGCGWGVKALYLYCGVFVYKHCIGNFFDVVYEALCCMLTEFRLDCMD